MRTANPLTPLVQRYLEVDAEGVARVLEGMPEASAVEALHALPPRLTALAVRQLQAGYAAALLAAAGPETFQAIAAELSPERASRIFARLPTEARERLVPYLPERVRAGVQELLTWPAGSVGEVMSTDCVAFGRTLTVREAVAQLRRKSRSRVQHSYAYVVDEAEALVGVLSTYDLLVASPGQRLADLTRSEVFTVDGFMDQRDAAEQLARRRYFAAPVVDAQRHLLGVVKAEQLLKGVKSDVADDIQRMFGAGAQERVTSSLGFSLRKRLPWLYVNLLTAFMAAAVIALFEGTIARVTALAVFLPVVAGQGGNAGAQSLAIVMRGLVMREIPPRHGWRIVGKEGVLGTIAGLATGAVTALVAWAWAGNPYLGLVVALGMLVNLAAAGLAGASIPIVLKRLGLDPAQSSNILLTTVTDVVGFFAFLGFAVIFLEKLVGS